MKQVRFDTSSSSDDFCVTSVSEFPTTRYQGSKRSIIDWIWNHVSKLDFDSVLDVFGGTGVFSHKAKKYNKQVFYNDYLKFNHQIGTAIIENSSVRLQSHDVDFLLSRQEDSDYPTFIQDEFDGLYFTQEENEWLDMMRLNIDLLDCRYKRSIAISALSQACLAKRPYNLFHRANLDMRTNEVDRSFGNKTTWDRSFEDHFSQYVTEYNQAVFDNGRSNRALNQDVLDWGNPPSADLVYLDPPYYDRTKDGGTTDYQFYYHFLEGFMRYDEWVDLIDESVKTKRIETEDSPWTDPDEIHGAFGFLFDLFSDSQIALSYNTAGLPTPDQLVSMLQSTHDVVQIFSTDYQYALSKDEDSADEILILAFDE